MAWHGMTELYTWQLYFSPEGLFGGPRLQLSVSDSSIFMGTDDSKAPLFSPRRKAFAELTASMAEHLRGSAFRLSASVAVTIPLKFVI